MRYRYRSCVSKEKLTPAELRAARALVNCRLMIEALCAAKVTIPRTKGTGKASDLIASIDRALNAMGVNGPFVADMRDIEEFPQDTSAPKSGRLADFEAKWKEPPRSDDAVSDDDTQSFGDTEPPADALQHARKSDFEDTVALKRP